MAAFSFSFSAAAFSSDEHRQLNTWLKHS